MLSPGPRQPITNQLFGKSFASEFRWNVGTCKVHVLTLQLILQNGFNAICINGKTESFRVMNNHGITHQGISFMYVVIYPAAIRQAGLEHWCQDFPVQITKIERHPDSTGVTA